MTTDIFRADTRLTQCPTTLATWELSYKYNFIPLFWRREVLGKIDTPQAKMINSLEKVADHFVIIVVMMNRINQPWCQGLV